MKTKIYLEGQHRQIIYLATSILIIFGYGLFIIGLTIVFGTVFFRSNPLIIAATLIILVVALYPLRSRLQRIIQNKLIKIGVFSEFDLQQYNNTLATARSTPKIIRAIREEIIQLYSPDQIHIYLYDPVNKHYSAWSSDDQNKLDLTTEITFEVESHLVKSLADSKSPLLISKFSPVTELQKAEYPKIALLGASLFIPIRIQKQFYGWIALGNKRGKYAYRKRELDQLQELGDQTASALDRIQVSTDLERRVNEMNVLTRISQGINITLALDDMLELIFAQLSQIIQMSVFELVLRDPEKDSLSSVFYVDDDERIVEKENQIIKDNHGLDREIVNNQRPIVTNDYTEECKKHGVIPTLSNIYAWMGIPLNTGAETIGLISIGSRHPDVIYSSEHINLLQSVADQTAGAMIKVKLLQEAERRTNQLRLLNEIIRNLSQTLEPDVLLQRVLESAIELVNSKSGNIFLIDMSNGELNPVERSNINQSVELSSYTLSEERWKVINLGKPIILNDLLSPEKPSTNEADQTGQMPANILIVPIQLKNDVLGIIEVYDRIDRLPFTKDDQELLSAFASQSAIAYENARKYTFTDRSLAARLEELSVMQRIDRELNASLDVARAMQITLAWAIRQSNADAGIVGIVNDTSIQVMASHGYEDSAPPEELLLEKAPILKQVIEIRQPQTLLFNHQEDNLPYSGIRILEGALAQFVIPIQREEEVIGIILLESRTTQNLADEKLEFMLRLSDHAAIAIANAQLFLEIKAANLAKSEFVSFVSHELKTPMTSIKGFADLLAAGAVGPINEAQNNFLSTIRSNVDRMATLVSDLSDVSRIEAGRIRLEFEAVPVKEVLSEIIRSTNNQLESKGQSLKLEIEDKLPPFWGDRVRLIQILTNLVSNANKYSPPNAQIIISAEQSRNIWDASGPAQVIHISVKDHGFGIGKQDQEKIFEKFFRADDPNIREVSGTGLGLNITKTLVEMQGGKIWFESELNQGTTFHFTTPISENV